MAGRLHGRGGGRRAMMDQMNLQRGDAATLSTHPKPPYPPLIYPPIPFPEVPPNGELSHENLSQAYFMKVKEVIKDYFQNSDNYISEEVEKNDVERYADRFQMLGGTKKKNLNLNWDWYPSELRPSTGIRQKRKAKQSSTGTVKQKRLKDSGLNIEEKLKDLEQQEVKIKEEDEEIEEVEKKTEEEDTDSELGEEEEDMDEGTDYTNAYFDNGEDYNEEEDALEDTEGGVY